LGFSTDYLIVTVDLSCIAIGALCKFS